MILLGVVALISLPAISRMMANSRERTKQAIIAELVKSTKSYMADNPSLLPDATTPKKILVSELKNTSYVEENDVIDPTTGQLLEGCIIVTFQEKYKQYDYKYSIECN